MYILNLSKNNCTQGFKDVGIDCTCPFKIPASDNFKFEEIIETYSPVFLNNPWLVVGDYLIKAEVSDSRGYFFCATIGFTLA